MIDLPSKKLQRSTHIFLVSSLKILFGTYSIDDNNTFLYHTDTNQVRGFCLFVKKHTHLSYVF